MSKKKSNEVEIHFMTKAEERQIKESVPYHHIDKDIRELIKFINTIPGVATWCCCAGHNQMSEQDTQVEDAYVSITMSEAALKTLIFKVMPKIRGELGLLYMFGGELSITIAADPSELKAITKIFKELKEELK